MSVPGVPDPFPFLDPSMSLCFAVHFTVNCAAGVHSLSAATMLTTMEVVVEELWTSTVDSRPIITPHTGLRISSLSWNTRPAVLPSKKLGCLIEITFSHIIHFHVNYMIKPLWKVRILNSVKTIFTLHVHLIYSKKLCCLFEITFCYIIISIVSTIVYD